MGASHYNIGLCDRYLFEIHDYIIISYILYEYYIINVFISKRGVESAFR